MSFTKINHYEKEYADNHITTRRSTSPKALKTQPIVSPYFTRRKKRRLSTDEYVEGILAGNITTLSQAITLVESNNPAHYAQAQEIIERCLPHAGKSVRIGITGRPPGAGKLDLHRGHRQHGHLAAAQTGGAGHRPLVGTQRGLNPRRQNPHGEHFGQPRRLHPSLPFGRVAGRRGTQDTRDDRPGAKPRASTWYSSRRWASGRVRDGRALDGRHVHAVADFGCRRRVRQGIKRGIMEMADIMVITKADGENIHKAELAKTQLQGALRLFPVPESGLAAQSIHLLGRGRDGARRGMERRRGVPRPHPGQRLFPPQPQPPEQILDVRVDQTKCCATRSTTTRRSKRASRSTKSACWRTKYRRSSPPEGKPAGPLFQAIRSKRRPLSSTLFGRLPFSKTKPPSGESEGGSLSLRRHCNPRAANRRSGVRRQKIPGRNPEAEYRCEKRARNAEAISGRISRRETQASLPRSAYSSRQQLRQAGQHLRRRVCGSGSADCGCPPYRDYRDRRHRSGYSGCARSAPATRRE